MLIMLLKLIISLRSNTILKLCISLKLNIVLRVPRSNILFHACNSLNINILSLVKNVPLKLRCSNYFILKHTISCACSVLDTKTILIIVNYDKLWYTMTHYEMLWQIKTCYDILRHAITEVYIVHTMMQNYSDTRVK